MTSTLLAAAVSGIVVGASGLANAQPRHQLRSSVVALDDMPPAGKGGEKHACRGQNACKGQGGCKTDKHACKGQNACKGQGGCKH